MGTTEQFETEMEELYERMKEVLPYPPTQFLKMLRQWGGVETARRLVERDIPSTTFLRLVEQGHPELTAEAYICKPAYSSLFSPEVRRIARGRVEPLGPS